MQDINYSVPVVDKNAPLAIDLEAKVAEANPVEKRGKALFVAGCIFSAFILVVSWLIFWAWLNS